MTIPPLPRDPEDSRPHYKEMRKLLEDARRWGLGDDFIEAVHGHERGLRSGRGGGATIVRVRERAIFGARGVLNRERQARGVALGRED